MTQFWYVAYAAILFFLKALCKQWIPYVVLFVKVLVIRISRNLCLQIKNMKEGIRSAVLGAMCYVCMRYISRFGLIKFNKSIAFSNNKMLSIVVLVGMKVASKAEKYLTSPHQ